MIIQAKTNIHRTADFEALGRSMWSSISLSRSFALKSGGAETHSVRIYT